MWQTLRAIPFGSTRTYKEIAAAIGNPNAARAVGHARRHEHAHGVMEHRVARARAAVAALAPERPAARPVPEPGPVMTATFPSSSPMCIPSCWRARPHPIGLQP